VGVGADHLLLGGHREGNAELSGEISSCAGVVLGDGEESDVVAGVGLVDALEKREGELANRAGDLEKGEDDRTFLQRAGKGVFLSIE